MSATIVNSPLASSRVGRTAVIGPLTNCSCTFVSSRPTTTSQSPTARRSSSSVDVIRCGASKNTTVPRTVATRSNHCFRSALRVGGKPKNENDVVSKPATARAASTALGPGMGSTRIPASIAARTRRPPGSETVGVPASDTSATSSPRCSRSTSAAAFLDSLCSCRLVVGVAIAWRARSCAVRRVSSAAITAASRSTRRARTVMSSRLPMGVATTNSVPGMSGRRLLYHWPICVDGASSSGNDRTHAQKR